MRGYVYSVCFAQVATIDKGKRTSSQKSWRQVWAVLKDRKLCLSKECGKAKNHPQVI